MSEAPLAGITVIEIAGIGPAPFACNQLEDMGATIVKIDRPGGHGLPETMSSIGSRPRPTVSLNLKDAADREVATTLVAHADVLVDPYRPGVAERLGIGPEEMCKRNPRLVYARMTGWGQDGPYAAMAGHDINYIGLSGSLAAIGPRDEPMPPLNLVGDYGGGAMFAVTGILAALVERATTGVGQVIDVAMVDGAAALTGPIRELHNVGLWSPKRRTNLLDGGAPFYACYRTSDDEFMAVGALEPQFYSLLVAGLGLDESELGNRLDPREWPGLATVFSDAFASRTRQEWTEVFDGTDACVTPVLSMGEVGEHPHNAAREALIATASGPRPHPAPRFSSDGSARRTALSDAETVEALLVSLGIEADVVGEMLGSESVSWD
ncbi:MAG: CaiB/BaiF CoA-transferase family protein [Actinomycetota bacterium]